MTRAVPTTGEQGRSSIPLIAMLLSFKCDGVKAVGASYPFVMQRPGSSGCACWPRARASAESVVDVSSLAFSLMADSSEFFVWLLSGSACALCGADKLCEGGPHHLRMLVMYDAVV